MKRLILILCLLVALDYAELFSQSKAELKNNFFDAESWILFEAYKDALPLYLQLLEQYPDNANFKYRIGQCYLNIPGAKDKAIKYLEEAAANINPLYKEGKFTETGAPNDVLYFLANAYRVNNQLDKAIETYELFKKNLDIDLHDSVIVNSQIQSCRIAKELMAGPLEMRRSGLGDIINSGNSVFNPVVSDKEDMIVYSRSEAFYDAILYSVRRNGEWQLPLNMNEILKVDRDLFPTSLSADGKMLYLYSSADYDGVIYSSRYENETWEPLVRLNGNINTKYWESHATVSHDNQKLYFTSNRKGSYGGLDIYVSKRDSSGDWGTATNLGPVINTPFDEESPFLSKDDKTLYFSSRGHYNMGGYDIFSSRMKPNGEWSEPINEGYPLNTTGDDIFFKPAVQTGKGFYAARIPEGNGKQEIYQIDILSGVHQRQYLVYGVSAIEGMGNLFADSVKLTFTDRNKPDQVFTGYTNPVTHTYSISLPVGEYKVEYEGSGGKKVTKEINLPVSYEQDTFRVATTELPRTDFKADLALGTNNRITVEKGDSVIVPVKVEPRSFLIVENWVGKSLVHSEKHDINSDTFNYKVAPETGENKVIFKLTDRFNNISTTELRIRRIAEKPAAKIIQPVQSTVVAKKPVNEYLALLTNRSGNDIKKLIKDSKAENKQFKQPEDVLSYLGEAATKRKISTDDINRLSLRVAMSDNVLTTQTIKLLASGSEGEMKELLSNPDITGAGLKTWSGLLNYLTQKSEGRIAERDLNDLSLIILGEADPGISLLRDKVLAYSDREPKGNLLREAVTSTDKKDIRLRGQWLDSFYHEAMARGFQASELSELLLTISSMPRITSSQYLTDLTGRSVTPVNTNLKLLEQKGEKIKSPEDILTRMTEGKEKDLFPVDASFKTIANLIVARDIPAETILGHATARPSGMNWITYVISGVLVIVIALIIAVIRSKRKK